MLCLLSSRSHPICWHHSEINAGVGGVNLKSIKSNGNQQTQKAVYLKYKFIEKQNDDVLEILDLKIMQNDNYNLSMFKTDEKIIIKIKYNIKKSTLGFRIGFDLVSKSDENILFRSFQDELNEEITTFNKGIYESALIIPENILNSNIYTLKIIAGIHNNRWIVDKGLEIDFETINTGVINKIYSDNRPGLIMPLINIKTTKYDT